jgi:hypothetical protein
MRNKEVVPDALISELEVYKTFKEGFYETYSPAPNAEHIDKIISILNHIPLNPGGPLKPMISSDGEVGVYFSDGTNYFEMTIEHEKENVVIYTHNFAFPDGKLFIIKDWNEADDS